jgi:hypothetical protein
MPRPLTAVYTLNPSTIFQSVWHTASVQGYASGADIHHRFPNIYDATVSQGLEFPTSTWAASQAGTGHLPRCYLGTEVLTTAVRRDQGSSGTPSRPIQ